MKVTIKKLTAIAMSVLMVVAMLPVMAFAASVNDLTELNTAIENSENILLEHDIMGDVVFPEEYTGTLDLNGKTILGTTTNNGILTITDTSEEKTGALVAQNTGDGSSALTNNGELTVQGGTYTREEDTSWYVVVNKGTIREISGGTFQNADSSASAATFINYDTIDKISGGTFTGGNIALKVEENAVISDITGGTFRATNANGSALQNWGTVKITDGLFEASSEQGAAVFTLTYEDYISLTAIEGGTFEGGYAIYSMLNNSDVSGSATITVSGGDFTGEVKSNSSSKTAGSGSTAINIQGGTFDGRLTVESTDDTAVLNVTGGSFTDENVSDYLQGGLTVAENAEGQYVVLKDMAVTVAFEMDEETTEEKTAGVEGFDINLGDELPAVTKAEHRFDGWKIGEITGVHKTLTAELLQQLQTAYDGTALTAIPSFTEIGAPVITISETENGTVSTSDYYPEEGDTVVLTVAPDTDYLLKELTVSDGTDKLEVTDNGDGTHSFTYDGGDVTVSARFVKELPFTDVSVSQWYYDAIVFASENGLFDGTTPTTFHPTNNMTRAMMARVLFNMTEGAAKGEKSFEDVTEDQWYYEAISWAASNDIVHGVGDDLFAPNHSITREQMALMLYNYATVMEIELPVTRPAGTFADADQIGVWAKDAVDAMYAAEVINGKENNRFDPQGYATRAEIAEMFMNFLTVIAE